MSEELVTTSTIKIGQSEQTTSMSYLNVPSFSKYLTVLYLLSFLTTNNLQPCGGFLYYVAAKGWVLAT